MNSMYIRTKNGRIIDTTKIVTGSKFMDFATNDESFRVIFKTDPLAKSENLEELCDEFVYQTGGSISKGNPMISINDFLSLKEWYVTGGINQNNIFGAIWTSKGLIYVAKMNDEGELELI